MFCRSCGTANDDNAVQCSSCGVSLRDPAPQQAAVSRPDIPTRLAPAILVTLFCCLPFGIVAIVYAAQVSGKVAAGDIPGALECSRKASMWCWLSFWLGLIPMLIYLAIMVIGGIAGVASSQGNSF